MTKIVLKFLLLLFVPFFAQARDTDSLRVLWVGNSYTYYNDMPSTVRQIAATQKVKLSCTRFLKGGERLSGHLKTRSCSTPSPRAAGITSSSRSRVPRRPCRPGRSRGKSTLRRVRSTAWCTSRRPMPV